MSRPTPVPAWVPADLPPTPGVYQFEADGGTVLYVGKSVNLRRRVRGWFYGAAPADPRRAEMLALARRVTVETTGSDLVGRRPGRPWRRSPGAPIFPSPMARLPAIDPDSITDERVRAGFQDMIERMGEVTENLRVVAHKPVYVELIRAVSEAIDAPTDIDPTLEHLVQLKVARLTGCAYSIDLVEGCLIDQGVTDAKIHELDFYEESTLFDDRERLGLRLAEQMVLDAVDDELFDAVRREFPVREALELVMTVCLESFYCLLNRTLGLKAQGFRERAVTARGAEPGA